MKSFIKLAAFKSEQISCTGFPTLVIRLYCFNYSSFPPQLFISQSLSLLINDRADPVEAISVNSKILTASVCLVLYDWTGLECGLVAIGPNN